MTSGEGLEPIIHETSRILINTVQAILDGRERVAVMYSGGLDSALLAHICKDRSRTILYTIGVEDSHDLIWAREAAGLQDLTIKVITINDEDILNSMASLVRDMGMTKPRWMTTFIPFNLALSRINETTVLCGQGADELFGGYKKYHELKEMEARLMMSKDLKELLEEETGYYQAVAGHYGKTLHFPYLASELISLINDLNSDILLQIGHRKHLLVETAVRMGLTEDIARRPKKAMQYGSGVSKTLKKILKDKGLSLDQYIKMNL